MDTVFNDFKAAYHMFSGYALADTLSPKPPLDDAGRLYAFYRDSNHASIHQDVRYALVYNNNLGMSKAESTAWVEVFVAYWKAVGEILATEEAVNKGRLKDVDWSKVYEAWKEVTNGLIKGHQAGNLPAWTIPCLYLAGKYLRIFAIKADDQGKSKGAVTFDQGFQDDVVSLLDQNVKLEDAARHLMRMFQVCLQDRAPIEESRKWGAYYIANLLFKTHFKLNSISLTKNLLKTLAAQADMPSLEYFPKAHRVTYMYYAGVIHFLEEDYVTAESRLTEAYQLCHKDAIKNLELILTYLIPCHLLTTHTLPTAALLDSYPRLQQLFGPLVTCVRKGDLAGFDAALVAGEEEFVKRRIYLTLERGRDVALRNLLRKVYLAAGYEPLKDGQTEADRVRRSRIPIAEFAAAVRLGTRQDEQVLDTDEVECMIANMIYKDFMKAYISRSHGMVVLNKKGAFPGTGV